MKTVCNFCKTEYTLNSVPASPVQCAVCGHVWNIKLPGRKNSFLVFIAAICALLSAIIFTFVVVTKYNSENIKKNPLVAKISEINTMVDETGVKHFVVNGFVTNKSGDMYGVPNLLIVSHDDNGNIVAKQKFMSPATLLVSGDTAKFSHILSVPTSGVRKITVELKE